MARANVYSIGFGMAVPSLLLLGCEAATLPARPWVVGAESARVVFPAMPATNVMPREALAPAPPPMTKSAPPPIEVHEPRPLPSPAPSPAEPPATGAPIEVVHHAELRGRIEARAGKRLTIEPLVATSSTLPTRGSRADLWVESRSEDGEPDWVLFAEVEVATEVVFGAPMGVDLRAEDGEPGAEGYSLDELPRGSRVRLEWSW